MVIGLGNALDMDHQDWQTVTVRGKGRGGGGSTRPPPVSAHTALMRKLDSDAPVKLRSLSAATRQTIIQTRVGLSMNQTQLNAACSFPQNTIRDIESGKAIPTPTQLNVLSRVLKTVIKYD